MPLVLGPRSKARSYFTSPLERRRMLRLIKSYIRAARQRESRHDSPWRFDDGREAHLFVAQRFHRRFEVVAHQINRRPDDGIFRVRWDGRIARMNRDLARRE